MNFFKSRTVADITASLASIVNELKAHADRKIVEAGAHKDKISYYTALKETAEAEIAKAKAAAAKIEQLLS